jgi:hypothetical protein
MNSKVLLPVAARLSRVARWAALGAFVALGGCASQVDPESTAPAGSLTPCSQIERSSAAPRIRLITDLEYVNLVRDSLQIALAGPEAAITSASQAPELGRLPNAGVAFTENLALDYQTAAQNVARQAVDPAKMQSLLGNVISTPATDAQLNAFLATKVAELWNRSVTPAEAKFLKNIYNGSAALADGGAAHAFDMLLQAVLQAPSFLYRTEAPAALGCQ